MIGSRSLCVYRHSLEVAVIRNGLTSTQHYSLNRMIVGFIEIWLYLLYRAACNAWPTDPSRSEPILFHLHRSASIGAYIPRFDAGRFTRWRNRCRGNVREIAKRSNKRREEGRSEELECPEPGGSGSPFFMPATNLACHIGDACPVLSRLARMENRSRPPAENVELQLSSTEAVIRWYRRTLAALRHKSLIFTRRWRCRGRVRGSRCHGANKYGPIDRRVREEEEKKRRVPAVWQVLAVRRDSRRSPAPDNKYAARDISNY